MSIPLCVKASEIASKEVPACLARVAPVCLNLCGVACSRLVCRFLIAFIR